MQWIMTTTSYSAVVMAFSGSKTKANAAFAAIRINWRHRDHTKRAVYLRKESFHDSMHPDRYLHWTCICFANFSFDAIQQEIKIEIELTANHQGHFEVYLCPNNNPLVEADQDCFDRYPLQVVGQEDHLYIIPSDSEKKGTFRWKGKRERETEITTLLSTSIL